MAVTAGDAASLAAAVAAAPGGSTVQVPPGTYTLTSPLAWRPVNLLAESGPTDTNLVSPAGQDVVQLPSPGAGGATYHLDTFMAGLKLTLNSAAAHSYDRVLPDGSTVGAACISSEGLADPSNNHIRVKILDCVFRSPTTAGRRPTARRSSRPSGTTAGAAAVRSSSA